MSSGASGHGLPPPGFRLPAQSRLGRVRLQVADLGRSLDYYAGILGFVILAEEGARAVLGDESDGEALIELHERAGSTPVPRGGRLGLYHFAVLLPDRSVLGRFAGHLAATRQPVGASDHLVSEAIYLQDPDGLGIEVYADRPRSSWRWEGGQLQMDTLPLDVPDLLAAAGQGEWNGMPGGTRIGHVHLHVGSIAEARRFYHEALGFDAVVWSYPGALFLSAGGYHHHLGVNTWAAGAEPAGPGDARLIDWELRLPAPSDGDSAAESLRERGYPVRRDDGQWRVLDPWGIGLLLHSAV